MPGWTRPFLAHEPLLVGSTAGTLTAALAWGAPTGPDLAAHAYERAVFLHHGFQLWDNLWYAGRYGFVTYSLLYYPLSAVLGIRLLAVASVATAALAFALVVDRQWGPAARWSSRTFAVVWSGIALSTAFPFALGAAFALLAIWALQARRTRLFALLAALTLLASPLAFLLLAVVLASVGLTRRRHLLAPAAILIALSLAELAVLRSFPSAGRFPFPRGQLLAALAFCALGAGLAWRGERTALLRSMLVVYAVACIAAYAVPSEIGGNIARLRYAAVPLAVLLGSLRRWRPLAVCLCCLGFAAWWNLGPLARNVARAAGDPSARTEYWQPTIAFLRGHLTPSYRVEVVDTTGHWAAFYLPRSGIPIVRGWFRQDDFPQNRILYEELGPRTYRAWLRSLGVRYVVLTGVEPDYSARAEAALLRSGRAGLDVAYRTAEATIYAVPSPRTIVEGPAAAWVQELAPTRVRLELESPGSYRVAVRWSPYHDVSAGACLRRGPDGMVILDASRRGTFDVRFRVTTGRALRVLAGSGGAHCR